MKNIHAYTEINYKETPAFISINKKNDNFVVMVRSKESTGFAEIEMSAEQLEIMAFDIMQKLNEEQPSTTLAEHDESIRREERESVANYVNELSYGAVASAIRARGAK